MKKCTNICISYLGNSNNDTRITNLVNSLEADGCSVEVISFDWTTPGFQTIGGRQKVYKLVKTSFSLKYYLKFARILLKDLFKSKADIFVAEDIYTLPFVFFAGKLKRKIVYYNSRELYPFLAGLRNKKIVQTLIRIIERFFITKVNLVLTTGPMDAQFLEQYYKITNTLVIRNLPVQKKPDKVLDLRKELNLDSDNILLLYQGVLLEGRGLEQTFEALAKTEKFHLIILGDGVLKASLVETADKLGILDRVHFIGTVSQSDLINYTAAADVGLALIKNLSLSYYYALPNKLFEYISAGLPVIISDLPQMRQIIDKYNVGEVADIETGNNLDEILKKFIADKDKLGFYSDNCRKAAEELNWQNEYKLVKQKFLKER